jgi:hypothetical protein
LGKGQFFRRELAKIAENCDHNIGFWEQANLFAENWQKSQKIVIITLVFGKKTNFFAENWQKSQKIVIITSTPDVELTW